MTIEEYFEPVIVSAKKLKERFDGCKPEDIIEFYLLPTNIEKNSNECFRTKIRTPKFDEEKTLSIFIGEGSKKMVFRKFYMIWKLTKEGVEFDPKEIRTESICGNDWCINPDHIDLVENNNTYVSVEHVDKFIENNSGVDNWFFRKIESTIVRANKLKQEQYKIEELENIINKLERTKEVWRT